MRGARVYRLLGVVGWLAAAPLTAQTPSPVALTGRAVRAADDQPIPYSLVVLVPAAGGGERGALTTANGSFRFDSVAAGEYRLRLDRVGLAPEQTAPIRFDPARPQSVIVRSRPRRAQRPPTWTPDTVCHRAAEVARLAGPGAVWREAAVAVQARRLFARDYTYTLTLRDVSWMAAGPQRVRAAVAENPMRHTPEIAVIEELRASATGSIWGNVGPAGFRLIVPDLPELFGRGFLAEHCVQVAAGTGEYRIGLQPRPSAGASVGVLVAATLVLDSSLAVTRVELQYMLNGRTFARGTQQYLDPGFPGGQLRFPGRLDMEEIPRLAGASHWAGRTRFDNYRIVPDTVR